MFIFITIVLIFLLFIYYPLIIRKALLLLLILSFICSIALNPKVSYEGAKLGVSTWINVVLPALLPFFIGTEMLIRLGFVRFIGTLLEPIVKPIFNVPGEGSFIFLMSIASGYPMGVKLTSQLREDNLISKEDGQRLLSFCSTSGPLFILGAVAIGMFQNKSLGILILISHYLGSLMTGFTFRFYKKSKSNNFSLNKTTYSGKIKTSLSYMKNTNNSFGVIFSESVKKGMEVLFVIGGYIILFSVLIQIIKHGNIIEALTIKISSMPLLGSLDRKIYTALISGFIEITVGCRELSLIESLSFRNQAVFASLIISWSGLSIHAQSLSIISKTDLSCGIYIFSKVIHSFFSALLAFSLCIFYPHGLFTSKGVFNDLYEPIFSLGFMAKFKYSFFLFLHFNLGLLLLGLFFIVISKKNRV
ncbi:sporulation integral membrane protein YlbJ [Anaeromicrobium sediminis]|uniref:Sporulation integral membrane protein YlbJ n=1 Tax=Anaeromicrobium sediminis TaxID=1478221 RepID=A0A267MJB5_9FIRM|nr:sporulation integral membrane protein YlbJ [Anaeromicrobium sediminis]PAB58883.1 sporulation integral membrane protein YlbJ [Anaeromicrobium sediminis]